MELIDRLVEHDAWTTRELLERARALTDEALDFEFDLGLRTLRRTFVHIIRNVDVWSALVAGEEVAPPRGEHCSVAELIEWHSVVATRLARVAHETALRKAWDEEWVDTLDEPPTRKSRGGAILHVITHSMHHRGQAIHMLKRLGVRDVPEGDLLSWEAWRKRQGLSAQ